MGVEVEAIDVTKDFDPDPELNETLEKYTDVVEGKMGEVLGEFKCDLDGRFSSVRTKETNLGNLVSVGLPVLQQIEKRKKMCGLKIHQPIPIPHPVTH